MSNIVKLDCNACKKEKTMIPTKISKMSPVVVFIGWILAFPSMIDINHISFGTLLANRSTP